MLECGCLRTVQGPRYGLVVALMAVNLTANDGSVLEISGWHDGSLWLCLASCIGGCGRGDQDEVALDVQGQAVVICGACGQQYTLRLELTAVEERAKEARP